MLIGEKMHYLCAPELPPKHDEGNFCLTLHLDDVEVWQKTVKKYAVRQEDISKFSIWVGKNTVCVNPTLQLGFIDGVDIPFSEIEIITVTDIEYATLKQD
jgi:hypothetical protein